jgi:hypothetical protein
MGLLGRLFESEEKRTARVAREEEELRLAEEEARELAKAEREALIGEVKDALQRSLTVVAGYNNPDFLAFSNRLRDLTPKTTAYVQKFPQDYSFGFLSCFLTSLGMEVDAFLVTSRPRDTHAEGKLTITALALMAEHPECLAEILSLTVSADHARFQLRSSEVRHVMSVYDALWKNFVGDRDLVCPLDVAGHTGSVRSYLTARGHW